MHPGCRLLLLELEKYEEIGTWGELVKYCHVIECDYRRGLDL
jgi:hypothetical protein